MALTTSTRGCGDNGSGSDDDGGIDMSDEMMEAP